MKEFILKPKTATNLSLDLEIKTKTLYRMQEERIVLKKKKIDKDITLTAVVEDLLRQWSDGKIALSESFYKVN